MKKLSNNELQEVSGGWIPVLIGVALGAAITMVAFGK